MGVRLRVVRQDVANGDQVLPGKPPLRLVREVNLGGVLDKALGRIVRPSENPLIWYVGERQAEILLREDDEKTRTLLYSAEGGGKTFIAAQWSVIQVIRSLERGLHGYAGVTAPTGKRLQTMIATIGQVCPIDTPTERRHGSWATYYKHENELRFAGGLVTLQCRATKKYSDATGSPVQGYTWMWSTDDELQDTEANGADPDIEARLRGARVSRRMCTATAKDSTGWRAFRDKVSASIDWVIERLRFDETPFVWMEHWLRMQRNMTEREWRRRGLAEDVAPEFQIYYTFEKESLRRLPSHSEARDVTEDVIYKTTGIKNCGILLGHDPGQLHDVTIGLKAFRYRNSSEHVWFVVLEHTTDRTTTEAHGLSLRTKLQQEFGMMRFLTVKGRLSGRVDPSSPQAHMRIDPYGDTDSKPDKSVLAQMQLLGFQARSAAYKNGKGSGRVPKEAGIEMVVTLLRRTGGVRRLFVAVDENGVCAAPKLREAFEMAQRNERGEAEWEAKDEHDLSHWPASLRYALYRFEKLLRAGQAWSEAA